MPVPTATLKIASFVTTGTVPRLQFPAVPSAPVAEPLQVFAVFCAKEGEVAPAIRASQANARIQRARNPEAAPNRSGTASARFPNEAIPPKKYPSPR